MMKRVYGRTIGFVLALATLLVVPVLLYADNDSLDASPPPFVPSEGDTIASGVPSIVDGSPSQMPLITYQNSAESPTTPGAAPVIDVWYGNSQQFGQNGNPQRWVNILGRVSGSAQITSLTYSLNGGASLPLSLGPNNERLYDPGDFNIEIATTDLLPGANSVVITAVGDGQQTKRTVTVNYTPGQTWPLPYNISWAGGTSINNVAQVVDGKWAIQNGEIRPVDVGFDRLVAVGDVSWSEYEITVPVTVYSLNTAEWDDGYSNGAGVGFLVKWPGHFKLSGEQPGAGWRRFGALAWYRWTPFNKKSFEMRGNGGGTPSILVTRNDRELELNKTYIFKMSVQAPTIDGLPSKYRFKYWEQGEPEPALWLMQSSGIVGEPATGSILLVAHQADVGFGPVQISPLDTSGTFKITAPDPANGDIIVTPSKTSYDYGETVTVRALAELNYKLGSWGSDLSGTQNPVTFDITQNVNISANFIASDSNPKLALTTVGNGDVDVVPDRPRYRYGELVSLTPAPGKGHLFAGWEGDLTGADNPATLIMTSDKTITATFAVANAASPVSDDFDACALSASRWTFINPLGDGTVKTDGERIELSVAGGKSHNIWLEGNRSARVMQPTANSNFEIVTKFESDVTKRFQMQGLLVEQNEQNFLRFEVYHDGDTNRLFVAKFVDGIPTSIIHDKTSKTTPDYLRVTRVGTQWSYSYSMDGKTWTSVGSFTHSMTVSRSGFYAANHAAFASQTPAHTTIVDYFFNTASPIANEDDDTNVINVQKNGQGTVTLSPNKPVYSCGEVVTVSATPAAGWTFQGWSGDLAGSQTPQSITIDRNVNITATFTQQPVIRKLYLPTIMR